MSERIVVPNWPLYWPHGWPRTKPEHRRRASFRSTNSFRETRDLLHQLDLLGAANEVISTNLKLRNDGLPYAGQRMPDDPGVSLWFDLPDEQGTLRQQVLACDRWDRIEHNIRAIAKHIEALRGQDRWGVGSLAQAFAGYTAIAANSEVASCWDLLGLDRHRATPERVQMAWKEKARAAHPDHGGSVEAFVALVEARKQALAELGA